MNDPLFPALLILRYMHILGAIALFGGTLFMRFALAPSASELPDEQHAKLREAVRARWGKFIHISILFLLLSGLANMGLASRYTFGPGPNYNMLAGIKLVLALPIFFIASMLFGRSETSQKFRAKAPFWMNVNIALALVMVLLGGLLKFVDRKLKDAPPPAAAAYETPGRGLLTERDTP